MNSDIQLKAEPRPVTDTASARIDDGGVAEISQSLRQLLADVFALYLKTKNFHWHIGGPPLRRYPPPPDEHASQIFAMTDAVAERTRKLGGTTLHSVGDIARHQRLTDND